ncbi:MAG: NAD(P)H-dependent oxidoreductase subunit E [Bacteroidota bacterium]
MEFDPLDIKKIIDETGSEQKNLIPLLQAVQKEYNYLPEDVLGTLSELTGISAAQIIGVASFYSRFRFKPAGSHMIKVCVGTACHVKGAVQVHDAILRHFKLKEGQDTDPEGRYTIEKVNCLGCCTLAPVVQIDNVTYGHVATGQIAGIIEDFEKQLSKGSTSLFRRPDGSEILGEIRIGLGSCCVASGSDEIRKAVSETISDSGLNVKLKHVGCVGMCHQVPLVEIVPVNGEAVLYSKVNPLDVKGIIDRHFAPKGFLKQLNHRLGHIMENLQDDSNWEGIERYSLDVREKHVSSFLGRQLPVATEFRGMINPLDMEEYRLRDGFGALVTTFSMQPDEVIAEVEASGIRGRGGAGFPTGRKWRLVASNPADTKYVICNGDEGDPGAFMDRMLLESYPYRVIEGMIIAAYATGATHGVFYIRAEYPLAVSRISRALENCRSAGYLGNNILGSGFSFDAEISQGAGAFVCGEETALIASVEGNRGFPRMRPPFPAKEGLWGKPTLVNNTETLAQIGWIIRNGAGKFAAIGTDTSKGTKVFALAGKVARGGLIEVPMGISIREVVEEIGGGVANGRKFKAVQIGGPSGGCIPERLADTPIDFDSLKQVGAMMGSGGLVVLDDSDCMVDIARYFLSFTQNESCGKCTFCRIGTKRMLEILDRISEGKGKASDIADLEELAKWTEKGSLCGLGKTAPNPVLSTLRYFREEYEAHINGKCPTGKCKALTSYFITEDCIGCTKCAQDCPVDAIPFDPHKRHVVDTELCIKCDACRQVCPVNAVITR